MTDIAFTEPFELGYTAGIRGDDPRTNPYEKLTKEWREWLSAHRMGVAIVDVDEHLSGTR